jgi:O-antigen/teichoic acid export membrane protein
MNIAYIVIGCAAVLPFTHQIAKLLLGTSSASGQVMLVIASGAAGSIYRVTSNVVRMERRPVAFGVILAARPVVTLAIATPLVMTGHGIYAALIGTAFGSLIPGIAAFFVSRRSYSAAFSWSDFRAINDLGSKYIFVILGLFVVHNGDAFILSRFASDASVGVYRVATRLSSVISYLVSGFLLSWAPLERSTLFQATYQRYGKASVHKRLLTYYMLSGLTVMLALSLSGDVLVRLSPPQYRDAANLIPFSAFAFVIYGLFVVIARTTYHKHRDLVHNSSAALAAVVYYFLSSVLVPKLGGYGLALSAVAGMAIACACFRAIDRTASHYAQIDWPRLLGTTAIVAALIGLADLHPLGHGVFEGLLLTTEFFIVFPGALIATGIVTRTEAAGLRSVAVSVFVLLISPLRGGSGDPDMARALATLTPADLDLLRQLIKEGKLSREVAAQQGVPVSVVEARAGRALRALTGAKGSERDDSTLGNWLFSGKSAAEHDVLRHYLERYGIDIMTLQLIEAAATAARALPARAWPPEPIADQRGVTGDVLAVKPLPST